jgi:hypothetical protein
MNFKMMRNVSEVRCGRGGVGRLGGGWSLVVDTCCRRAQTSPGLRAMLLVQYVVWHGPTG